MNSLRPELLELTPQALTALSNAGFVKRSLKELENGNVPEISHENSALIATFSDGVRTQLANGQALKEAQCSCGARDAPSSRDACVKLSTTCTTAQPTEKEEAWDRDPAGRTGYPADVTRKRAQALVGKGITIELLYAGRNSLARLPMSDVRFYSRSSIVSPVVIVLKAHFATCRTGCAGLRRGQNSASGIYSFNLQMRSEHVTSSDDPFANDEGNACRQDVQQLSQALWLGGISQPLIH